MLRPEEAIRAGCHPNFPASPRKPTPMKLAGNFNRYKYGLRIRPSEKDGRLGTPINDCDDRDDSARSARGPAQWRRGRLHRQHAAQHQHAGRRLVGAEEAEAHRLVRTLHSLHQGGLRPVPELHGQAQVWRPGYACAGPRAPLQRRRRAPSFLCDALRLRSVPADPWPV